MLCVSGKDSSLFLDRICQLHHSFRMVENDLLSLLCKQLIVKLSQLLVHILASCIGQMLPVHKPSLMPGEFHQTHTYL